MPEHRGGARAPRGGGVGVQVEIHDRQQFELRLNYALGDSTAPRRYQLDAWFFIPRNVGVNRLNYPREQFYGDVTALMRLDSTPLALDRLGDPHCEASPLHRMAVALEQLRAAERPPLSGPLALHVKLYAHLYTVGVRAEVRRLEKLLGRGKSGRARHEDREGFLRALSLALPRMREALWAFRRVRAALWPYERLVDRALADAMRAADEYMSLFVDERIALLAAAVERDPARYDGSCFVATARQPMAALAAEEHAYRARYGYLTLTASALDGGEYFTYRTSLVKKSVQQALYLNPRDVTADRFVRNAVSAVAAALASIWALATQVQGRLDSASSRARLVFVLAAVLAYVAKDRIKALTGEYLARRVLKHDHAARLHGDTLAAIGFGMLEVDLREAVRFVSAHEVPADVRAARLRQRTVDHADVLSEEVIHYRKGLVVQTRRTGEPLPEGYRVRDILRVNVRHFTVRLDDPLDRVAYYDRHAGRFASADLPKVYHVNVVLKVRRESATDPGIDRLEHIRLVLNKDGIVRVEKV